MADDRLRLVSLAARGLWMDCLCLMHQSPARGYLLSAAGGPLAPPQLARAVGESVDTVAALLAELESAGVFSRDERGVIVCRRMVRDEGFRAKCSDAGKKGGGNPTFKGATKGESKGGEKGGGKGAPKGAPKPSEFRGQRTEEEETSSFCPESGSPTSGPNAASPPTAALAVPDPTPDPVLTYFPASGPGAGKGWPLTAAKLAEWEAAYPGLDCRGELRKAKQWLLDNPGRRKTLAGMARFLGAWLGRAQDAPRPTRGPVPFDRGAAADARITGQIFDAIPELFT